MPGARDDFPWAGLFQRSTEPVFVLNRARRLRFVNRAWEAWAGLKLREVRGLRCRRITTPQPERSWKRVVADLLGPPEEVMTGQPAVVRRHAAARAGAAAQWCEIDFLPLADADGVVGVVGRLRPVGQDAVTRATPVLEGIVSHRARHMRQFSFDVLDSRLPAVRRVAEQARLAAGLQAPVLIVGPPGAGKETLARIIHANSPLREQPLAALDCRRLPPFAVGFALFRAPARLGAVYLNDPAALPGELQARIAEVLGGGGDLHLPRLFVGCPADPAGQLVEELYHAVNLFRIDAVPLRARGDDLPRLVQRVLQRLNAGDNRQVTGLTPDAWEVVLAHAWPGNLDELYEVLRSARGHTVAELIDGKDLPFPLRQAVKLQNVPPTRPPRLLELDKILEQVERRLIELALERAKGNQTRAAEYLSIWRPRLARRMKALQLGGDDVIEVEGDPG